MRIVILNNDWEAADYGKTHRKTDDVILPIGPAARHYSLENNWKIRTLGSLWSKEDYFSAKQESENRIKTLVEELNDYSKSTAKNFPLTIGNYFHFQLHVVIGQIHYNRFIIDSIQKSLKPDSWLLYNNQVERLFLGFRPNPDAIFYDIFVLSPYAELGVVLKTKKEKPISQGVLNWRQIIKSILPKILVEKLVVLRYRMKINNWFSIGKRRLLLIGSLYDWESVFMDMRFKKNYYVDYNLSGGLIKSDVLPKGLLSILNNSITFGDTPVFDLSEQAKIIQGTLESFDKRVLEMKRKLKKYHAILSTVFVFPMQNLIGHLSNNLGKPIINWQHGEMNLYHDIFAESVEIRYTTHYLCYGDGVKPKYEAYIGHSPMKKVFTVGSTGKSITWKSGQYILYGAGKWLRTLIPFINELDPDTRLYNSQYDILSYLDIIGQNHEVYYKGHYLAGLNNFSFYFNNIKNNYTTPFTLMLKNAKLVILDSPATTCVETCSTEVPLFVLTGRSAWYQKPIKLLQKRAVLADSAEDLIHHVDNYLKDGTYPADLKNKEFLAAYGSMQDAEQVKINVIKALNEIIE